jgi:hypothetical protein
MENRPTRNGATLCSDFSQILRVTGVQKKTPCAVREHFALSGLTYFIDAGLARATFSAGLLPIVLLSAPCPSSRRLLAKGCENAKPKSYLQNYLPLADKRQGTTSVVPQMAHSDSGFSRCGISNN